ncbi:MAG: TonB-dependent siderophore receptor [Verrucomicrobiales bacterium]|nr:TonB-dependent siderophore receptor [Verrucomicrobiales bacterium]
MKTTSPNPNRIIPRRAWLFATLASSCLATNATSVDPAPASTAPELAVPTTELPGMLITGSPQGSPSSPKLTEPILNVPQTITVVPQTVIEAQGATTLRDVLRNVPGISIQAGEGGVPSGDNLSIRGFSARTDLFVDGVRDFGGYTRDSFNTEQVEVIKGPASTYSGRGSTGGSINLSTKVPHLGNSYEGTLGAGTDAYQRATLDLNQTLPGSPVSGTSLRLNGMWTHQEVAGRDAVENERWGVAPSIALGLGTSTRAFLTYSHLAQNNLPDYGIPWVPANTNSVLAAHSDRPAPVEYSNFYGLDSRDFEETVTDMPSLRIEHDFNESFTLRNLTRYGTTSRDSVITAPRFVNANIGTAINRQLQSRDQTDTILANQTDLTADFETWRLAHTAVVSVEFARETSENFARTQLPASATPLADLYHPDPDDAFDGQIVRTGAVNEAIADSAGISVFDTIKLSPKWQLSGGLRLDSFGVDYTSTATNGVATELDRTDEMLSWRAGVVFKPRENGSLYAAYGTSFNPSAEGLTLATTATAANNVTTDPEQSRTIEVGTKWEFLGNRLALSLALFRTDKTNARTEDPTDSTDVMVLDGEQRVQGVEFGASGRITKEWTLFAGYAWMDSEILASRNAAELGNELTNTPEHTFNFWSTYDLPANFQIGMGGQYVDARFANTTNTRRAPGYWLFDAMIGYRINQHVSLRLNIYNLADESYIDRVGGGHFVPGTGRTGTLTAAFEF